MIFAYNTVMSVLGIENMRVCRDHQLVQANKQWQNASLMCWWSHIFQDMYSVVTNHHLYKHTDWPPLCVSCMKNNKQGVCVTVYDIIMISLYPTIQHCNVHNYTQWMVCMTAWCHRQYIYFCISLILPPNSIQYTDTMHVSNLSVFE